jgi:phage tail protein X
MKYYKYKTLQGDTFDMIALDFYGDEKYASNIIQSNPDLASTIIFEAGVTLNIPVIEDTASSTLPPWRSS